MKLKNLENCFLHSCENTEKCCLAFFVVSHQIVLIEYFINLQYCFLQGDAINHNLFKNFDTFDNWSKSFWCGFGIFFPAVSGFLAGTNKSGELKVIYHFC